MEHPTTAGAPKVAIPRVSRPKSRESSAEKDDQRSSRVRRAVSAEYFDMRGHGSLLTFTVPQLQEAE